jgi:Family of unknown function (DUF6298)/Protein of unknown function (DUF4038)
MLTIKPLVSGECRIMSLSITRFVFYLILYAFFLILPTVVSAQAMGPLTRSSSNPNYFARPDGTPVYLVGSHHWHNLQDSGATFPPVAFNNAAYLNWMQSNNYNFMRLWNIMEQPYTAPWATGAWYADPLPYMRTGPGLAADSKPKFDLTKLNQAYFDRLRSRVSAAQQKGIYTAVMLFEGWSVDPKGARPNPWAHHPFNKNNNINGINGDPSNTGIGNTIQTTSAPAAALEAQRLYVRKVIDTVNEFDNVLYEISNESNSTSVQWQYNMINYIKSYQAEKPKKHPIGMTVPYGGGSNSMVFDSPADWVSPNGGDGYGSTPPANNGSKVIITDTDHIWGNGGNIQWVWRSFTQGINVIFMDDLGRTGISGIQFGNFVPFNTAWYEVRKGMTQTANYADRMNLRTAKPNGSLTSTGHMLAAPGTQYLVYAPGGGTFTVNLLAGAGSSFSVEWLNITTGATVMGNPVTGGSNAQLFTTPFSGQAALLLNKVSSLKGPSRVRIDPI